MVLKTFTFKKMITTYLLISNCSLFVIGFLGVLNNRKNVLIILIAIELMLLGINMNLTIFSIYLDDIIGRLFSLFV